MQRGVIHMISIAKDLMLEALKTILKAKKKTLGKITVNDIVEEAGVSKQTFYNYFHDKYDLFSYAVITVLQDNLTTSEETACNFMETIRNYYWTVLMERDFYLSFIRDVSAREQIFSRIMDFSSSYFNRKALDKFGDGNIPEDVLLAIQFCSIGNAKLVVDWMMNKMERSPETMAEITFRCIPGMLLPLL